MNCKRENYIVNKSYTGVLKLVGFHQVRTCTIWKPSKMFGDNVSINLHGPPVKESSVELCVQLTTLPGWSLVTDRKAG